MVLVRYPLRCVTLLLRTILILFQDTVDNTDERIELRADRRPRPDITRWHRIAQHLPDRARVDPKTTSRFALAQTLNHYRVANPPIQFHSLHPPPFAPKCKGISLTEFCSGATRLSGRFSEGLLLRRSHVPLFHYCESALLHGRDPIARSTASRSFSFRGNQFDPLDTREGTRDSFPISSAIVLQPTQDDAKSVFGALWVVRPIILKNEQHTRRWPNVRVKSTRQRLWCMDLRISISGSASVFESLSCLSSSTHRVATISPEPSTGS